ncbi:hypothetical protein H9P43_003412 [Blastocladiella emersonii ATCC 22665]|nr:hypothetical protein H9P43_003412 [Blastocladiella emersonii ATCC 22665]
MISTSSLFCAEDVLRVAIHAGYSVRASVGMILGTRNEVMRGDGSSNEATASTDNYEASYSLGAHSCFVLPYLTKVVSNASFMGEAWNVAPPVEGATIMIRRPAKRTDAAKHNTGRSLIVSVDADRSELPIAGFRKDLVDAIREHNLLVIVGETGSGKTTQIPQYILDDQPDARIVVTQPRRIAAISNAKRVAAEMGGHVGERVGYAIRFESAVSTSTQIRYVTDGVLLREIIDDDTLSAHSVVIIDEAHERTVGTDILLGLLKQCLQKRKDIKLLVMSATLDVEKFSDFFHECPIFQIPGRPYPVEILYSRNTKMATLQSTYVDRAIDTALHIHKHERPGDILVFLCGSQEIDRAVNEMKRLDQQLRYDRDVVHHRQRGERDGESETHPRIIGMDVFGIHASLETVEQRAVFRPARPGYRKIVFATNIAQTSITIPGIVFVVDCGFVKQNCYDPTTRMDALLVMPISRAAATQRAGRAGRTQPGKAYRLYSHETFETELPAETVPEIQRTSLLDTVLCLKAMRIDDVLRFDFLDPPDTSLARTALRQLYYLGALDDRGQITTIGHRIAHTPLSPFLACALAAAAEPEFACLREMLIIAAMLSVEHVWVEPRGARARDPEVLEEVAARRRKFFHPTGDHLTLYNLYTAWERHGRDRDWCRENYVQLRSLQHARNIVHQLECIVATWDCPLAPVKNGPVDPVPILRALCTAYFPNLAKKQAGRASFYQYSLNAGTGAAAAAHDADAGLLSLTLHPTSALCELAEGRGASRNGEIDHDVMYTSRANMRYVSRIWNWDWVAPYLTRLTSVESAQLSGASSSSDAPAASPFEAGEEGVGETAAANDKSADAVARDKAAKREAAVEAARARALARRHKK